MSETNFEVGDIVEWCGVTGTVTGTGTEAINSDYPVVTTFPHARLASFTSDGKFNMWHTEPSLKLVRKAKKKITVQCWMNLYKDNVTKLFNNKEEADNDSYRVAQMYGYRVTTVHLSKEIEI